jgi:hypothetical protein
VSRRRIGCPRLRRHHLAPGSSNSRPPSREGTPSRRLPARSFAQLAARLRFARSQGGQRVICFETSTDYNSTRLTSNRKEPSESQIERRRGMPLDPSPSYEQSPRQSGPPCQALHISIRAEPLKSTQVEPSVRIQRIRVGRQRFGGFRATASESGRSTGTSHRQGSTQRAVQRRCALRQIGDSRETNFSGRAAALRSSCGGVRNLSPRRPRPAHHDQTVRTALKQQDSGSHGRTRLGSMSVRILDGVAKHLPRLFQMFAEPFERNTGLAECADDRNETRPSDLHLRTSVAVRFG